MPQHVKSRPIATSKVVNRIQEILRLCTNKKILHLGCADMPFTLERGENLLHRQLLRVVTPDLLWGIDSSLEGITLLKKMGFANVLHGNVESLSKELKKEQFDIILAGEIIEHLENPGKFLESLKSIMCENSKLIISTVNATSIKQFIHALLRREKVHPDHNYYFSYWTLKQLLGKYQLKSEVYFYQETEEYGLALISERIFWYAAKMTPAWSDGLLALAELA